MSGGRKKPGPGYTVNRGKPEPRPDVTRDIPSFYDRGLSLRDGWWPIAVRTILIATSFAVYWFVIRASGFSAWWLGCVPR